MTNSPVTTNRPGFAFQPLEWYGSDDQPIRVPQGVAEAGQAPVRFKLDSTFAYAWDDASKTMVFTSSPVGGYVPLSRMLTAPEGSGMYVNGATSTTLAATVAISARVDGDSIQVIDGDLRVPGAVPNDQDSIVRRGAEGELYTTWIEPESPGAVGFAEEGFIRLGTDDIGIVWRNVGDSRDLRGMWMSVDGSLSTLRIGVDAGLDGERHDLPAEKPYTWNHGNPSTETMRLLDTNGLSLAAGLAYMIDGAPLRQAYSGAVEVSVQDDIMAVADTGEILSVVYDATKPNVSVRFSFSLAGTDTANTIFFEVKVGGTAVKGAGASCGDGEYASGAADVLFTGLPPGPYTFSVDWLADSGDASINGSTLPTRQHATLTIMESDA